MRPSCVLFLSILSIFYTTTTAVAARSWRPTGINLDPSCDPYTDSLDAALQSVQQMAISAFRAASGPDVSPYFFMFFTPSDTPTVRLVMKNILHAIGGHGTSILIKCNEDNRCIEPSPHLDVGAYVRRLPDYHDDFVNICTHTLDGGPRTRPVTNDWCSTDARNITLASILLHEFTHLHPIAEGNVTADWAWGQYECKELARLKVRDQYGEVLRPTENAQSYVWFAESQLSWASLYNGKICPERGKEELRKLLSAKGEDGEEVSTLVDVTETSAAELAESGGSGNRTLVLQAPPNSSDVDSSP